MKEQLEQLVNNLKRQPNQILSAREVAEQLNRILDSQPRFSDDGSPTGHDFIDAELKPRFVPGMVIGPGHGRVTVQTLESFIEFINGGLGAGGWERWETVTGTCEFFLDDLLSRVLHDPMKPRFVPEMVIGPGRYRTETHKLRCFLCRVPGSGEMWDTDKSYAVAFYPDDLSRVLYDPRKQTPEDFQKSTKQLGELGRQVEAVKAASWKPGQRLVGPTGKVYKLCDPIHEHDAAYQHWQPNGVWGPIHGPIHFSPEEFVPWPRVGDWVGCSGVGHGTTNGVRNPFQVSKVFTETVSGGFRDDLQTCRIADLEPAATYKTGD